MKLESTSDSDSEDSEYDCVECGGRGCVPNKETRFWEFWKPISEQCDRCYGTGFDPRRRAVFVGQPDGEGPYYVGTVEDQADLYRAMGEICANELCDFLEGMAGDSAELRFEIRYMTDAAIAALPEG